MRTLQQPITNCTRSYLFKAERLLNSTPQGPSWSIHPSLSLNQCVPPPPELFYDYMFSRYWKPGFQNPNQIQSRSKSDPDQIQISTKSAPNQTQTRSWPDPDQIQTRSRPDPNQIHSRSKPDPNQIQTRSKPDPNQIRPDPNQIQTRSI